MTDLATLQQQLDRLKTVRARGAREIWFADRHVVYRTDAELARAISALEGEIAKAGGGTRPKNVVLRQLPNRGW